VRSVGGTLVAVVVGHEEGEPTRLGELVPMNWSAGTPAGFHLIPCG
jgi:hypothetical protein